jgi:hypothetical protein
MIKPVIIKKETIIPEAEWFFNLRERAIYRQGYIDALFDEGIITYNQRERLENWDEGK